MLDHNPSWIAVERAIAEFRAARPVVVFDGDKSVAVAGIEGLDTAARDRLEHLAQGSARLVLTAARLKHLGLATLSPGTILVPSLDPARLDALAASLETRQEITANLCSSLDAAALDLVRLSLTLPAAIVVPDVDPAGCLRVSTQDITSYKNASGSWVHIVSRAPVPLDGSSKTEFVVFRGGEGLRDQIAIVIGEPDFAGPVSVRLHSACLTGDLFGSLKCDCGDQLRQTVRALAEGEGGILLYLDQEGRGHGIANKIAAYALQAKGTDTYAADNALGFGGDRRRFAFAAEMLRQLGVRAVKLLTNNPDKIAAMEAAGLHVEETERVIGRKTAQNLSYLTSKRDNAGHMIDLDTAPVHASTV